MKSEHHSTTRRLLAALTKDTSETEIGTDGVEPHVQSIPPAAGSGSEARVGAATGPGPGSGSGSGLGVQQGLMTKSSPKRAKVTLDPDRDRYTASVAKKKKKVVVDSTYSERAKSKFLYSLPFTLVYSRSLTHLLARMRSGRHFTGSGGRM